MAATDDQFAAQVADPSRHAVADFSIDSDLLLVLFGGIAGGVSMPVYEFFRVTDGYPVKRLFLRDPRHSWYLRGLPGVGDDAKSILVGLDDAIRQSGARRVVMAGASAGGFAALHFGSLLGVQQVLAFSPQTFIDARRRAAAGDDRWAPQIDVLHAALGSENPQYDVLPNITAASGIRFSVHVSDDDPLDLVHSARLEGLPGVATVVHPGGGHRLVKFLRDSGALRDILAGVLGEPAPGELA
ncbi:MAG: hypothetical protein ACR2J8_00385 [Thermomicrobiales bacterium]